MNIIGNNCLSGHFYKKQGLKFNNPFTWMSIEFDDFIYLIKNFKNINFNIKEFSFEMYKKRNETSVLCIVDNALKLHYIHFIQKEGFLTPTKRALSPDDVNIFTNDAIKYCKEKYENRLIRMKDEPIFMYSFNYSYISEDEYINQLNKLIDCSKEHRVLLLIHNNDKYIDLCNKNNNKNLKFIVISNDIINLDGAIIIDKIKNEIQKKIDEYEK